ncbi:hypothetical protein [Salinimicrobium sp. HB62]|uniref:hypothetical protein n=1 Tax=Salinimicrobium sp. HB62 TaxID=3077781 RepID=UPI002D772DFD|nr:hypothetical protein [Salinimicrobium sp. HB62]
MVLPLKLLELEFTVLEFHSNYVLSIPREGQVLEGKQVADLIEVCSDFYKRKPFVYLSYRVNDYNVNPTIYLDLDKVKNLVGIGVVSKKVSSLNMANFEKRFCKLPYEIFLDLEPAREWVKEIVREKK